MISFRGTLLLGLVVAVAANAAVAEPKLSVASARYGAAIYLSERWGLVYSSVENPTEQDINVVTAARFKADPNLTYASKVWVPAGARRKIVQPLRVPKTTVSKERGYGAIDLNTSLLNTAGTREYGRDTALVSVVTRSPAVVMIFGDEGYENEVPAMVTLGSPPKNVVEAEQAKQGARRTLVFPDVMMRSLRDSDTPASELGWDVVDYVVIAARNPVMEPGQLDALRRYLVSGGRVWVLLDRVDPTFCRRLLGEDFTVDVIDRVQRHVLSFETGTQREPYKRDLGETPVDMVRVAADGFDVMLTVDGWPAAMRRDVGQGKLIITTIGAAAWLEEDNWDAEPLRDLSGALYRPRYRELLPTERLAQFAQGQIGYEIIDRNTVGTALIAFAVLLLVGGLVLLKLGKLEWQAPGAVVLALVVTGVVMAMGKAHQSKAGTSPTVAGATWARVDADQQYASLSGSLGFFSPSEVELPLRGSRGGVVWPDAAQRGNDSLRATWFGAEQWQWTLPPLKPGAIQAATLHQTFPLDPPVAVRLSFTENQIIGEIEPGTFGTLSDLVLATPAGHMLPQSQGAAKFVIPANQRPIADQFLGGQLSMTETQSRRQEVYRELLNPDPRTRDNYYPSNEMVLMGWTESMDNGLTFVEGAQRRDETLVSLPVTFVRPEPGAKLTIPPQLITRHWYRGPKGRSANIYDAATDQFIATRNVEQEFLLGFRFPDALMPLEFESMKLSVEIKAADWSLELLHPFDGNEPLASRPRPTGTVSFELTDYEGFTPDADGSVYVRCRVKSDNPSGQGRTWDITHMRITAKARVPETSK